MESDLSTCLRQLKTCLDTQQIPQARSIIDRITQLIVEKAEESQAETDFNLECMLTSANGLVAFLNKSFSSAKHFGKVIESTFELFRKTIEKHSPLMGKRMVVIVPIALQYIQSSSVPARSRELAALVLQDSVAYGCLQNGTYAQLDQLPAELLLVFQQGKLPNRFQQNLYELLGQLAQNFPASIPEPDRVRDIFLNAAEKQLLEENYPSLVSLAGAVRGLDLFLVHFAPSENDRELRQRLYLLVKKLSIWEASRSERAVFRNALHVVGNHAPLFSWQLYADHVHWQTMLAGRWIKSSSQEDRDAGLKALYAFHGEVARVLSTPELAAERGREYPPKVDVLNQYVNYYRKLLSSATVDRLEIRIAIRGFGIMAGPCQQLAGASSISLNELLTIVLQRIEGICERSASSTADMLVYLPDFIQALSEILTHVQQLSTVQLVSVQTMTVALVRDFYHISNAHHELIVRSVVSMLENIGKLGGTTRHQLLDTLPVPSSNVAAGDTAPKIDWKRDLVTYKNYLPLWQGLLEKAQSAHDSSLLPALYRALMNTLFVIVEKLDLSTRKRTFQDDDGQEQELFFSDPNIDLLPTKPKDYHIFLNLVELYRDMLHGPQTPAAVRELFADWIRPYFERFVRQSLNRPLVSGFVKLIEMGLATAERIGYFRQQEAPSEDFRTTQMLLAFYLEQTIQRALYAIGELQLACLRFVLNAPVRLLVDFIEDKTRKQPLMVDVFRTAFRLGRSLLSIARAALYSLQRIVRFRYPPLRREIRERLLRQSGTRPCIKLDSIVGRVCELAVECSDRATKLAACELLHTIVLYLLGISYQDQLAGLWTIHAEDQKLAKGLRFIAKHLRNRTLLAGTAKDRRIPLAARKLLQDCYEAIGQESVCLVLSPSATRFGTIVLEAIFGLADSTGHGDDMDGLVEFVISCSLSEDMLQPNIRHGEHFIVCFGGAVYELFLQNPSNSLPTLFKALKPENFSFIVRFLCNLMDYSYRKQAANTDCLKCLVEMLLAGGWSPLFDCSRLQSNQFGACDVQLIELMSSVAMICPFPLNEIHHRVGPTYGRWLTDLIGSTRSELSIELKAKAIVLLPTLLGPNGAPEAESHWAEVENALESLQTKHFPLRSVEFPPNSPERIGYLNCLERLLDAMVISRSPLLLKAIIQMTAPDGDGHIAEAELRTAIERFFADQPHEMQCKRLLELWELFANHAYAPVVRETILRRYLCTALWHCRYDSIVQFYTRIIRALSHNTMVEINGRTGWVLEHALIDRAASYRLVEHYAALLPKQILTGDNCPVAQELNEELYLEGTQEQEQLSRTFERRVAIRREGGAGGDPAQRKPALKDPGLSVVMESSLSQQVFRFDMSHSVVLSAREVAQKDAAELAKRQQGRLSNVSLERTKINRHEIMATVCGCIRHMAATKVPLDSVVHFLVGSLADPGQQKNVRLFLAKVIDNCRNELQPHAALLIGPLMQLIVDGYIFRGLNPLVTDLIALVLEWNASGEARRSLREGATGEIASLASVLLRFIMKHACPQQSARKMAVLRLNLELIQEVIVQWHEALTVPAELLFEMVSHRQSTEDRSQLQLIAGLQLGTIVLLKGRGKLVPWMESTKQDYLRAVLRCLDLPDSTSFKSAALLLGHSLAHLYPDGFPEPEQQTGELETFHTECIAKLTSIQREYDRKFAEVLYETAKGFPSIADPFLSVLSYRFPSASGGEKRLYLELLLGGRLEKFNDELYRELASMELTLLLQDGELQLPTLHLLNRSLSLVRELEHLQQLVEPIGRVATEPSTPNEARAVAFEILIYIHEHRSAELSEECRTSVWRNLIRGLCGSHETELGSSSIRGRILEYLTDSGKLPSDVKERFLFVLAQLYDPTVEGEFLGNAVALLLDPAIRCRESKDRLFLHEYLNADVKFCEYTIETAARQRHTMTLLTPMFAETSQQRQLQSFITGRGSQMEQLIRATQLGGLDSAAQKQLPFEPTQDPGRLTKGNETFAMPTQQHTLLFESSALQLNRRSQRTGSSTDTAAQQDRSFERLRKRILKDSATNRQQQTAWAVSRHYASQRQRTEQRRDSTSKVTLYRRYRLADYPDLQINLLAFLLPLQALCRRDTTCARQTFVAIFNGLVECLLVGDSEGRTGRMVGDEWDRFVGRLDEALNPILESTKACDPNLFGGLIELTLGKASGKFTLSPRTIASVAGTCNMLPMGALYLEAKLADGADFDDEPVRTAGSVSSEADHWLQLSTLYHALHEHSVMVGIFGEKLDSDPQLREAIELEALGRYGQAHRAYCELVMRVSRARVDERNFCYKSAFNCLLQLGQWDVLLDEIGNQVTNHEELWCDEWNQENLLPHYVHGNALLVLAGDEGGREFYRLLEQWLHMPQRERHIRQEFGEQLTALYLSAQDMVRARLFGEQTKRQFLDEWHCSGVLSELVRTECLLSVRKVIELVAYSELLERSTKELEQAAGGLVVSWNNAQPTVTDSLLTWDTLLAYRRFLLEQLETKCTREEEEREKSDSLTNVTQLSKLLFELELNLLDVAFEQDNVKFAGKIIARLRAFEACLREPQVDQVLRRKIARIRYDRVRVVEASAANLTSALLRGFKQLVKLNSQLVPLEQEAGIRGVKQRAWTEFFHHSETVRTMLKTSSDIIEQKDSSTLVELMQTAMNTSSKQLTEEPLSLYLWEGNSSANDSSMEQLADAHLRLARYCYDELDPARTAAEELPVERLLLTSLLPAIKYGSREARHLFPVLLQLRNLQNGVLGKEFHENACSVPSWNFLPWIPQLLSYMQIATPDRPLAPSGVEHFLDEVLMRLVQEYPMALYFPARLLLGELLQPGASVRSFVYQFRAALSFPVLDHFVTELYRVVMPETRLSNMIAELKRHLASVTDQPSYHTFIERLVPDVFPLDTNDLWRYGQAYRAALPLVERFRTLQSLHPVDDRGTILAKLQELETNLESMRPRTKTTRLQLEDLSPWLADYHSSGQRGSTTQLVEIPGQYGLDRGAPSPTQHVTIVKVMPDVVVYGTLRLPIQLTFRGSDGNEYRFLAKFGEDLRQDQRIQQLQREITHRLRWDQRCREQQLQLRTYDVVPILPNFGLFGWLEGTVAMSEIAKQAAPRYNPGDRGQAHVHHEFGRFLMSVSKQLDPSANDSFNLSSYNAPALYGMAAAFCMPDRLQSKFVEL
uniref:Non-specific serine/threonine protein kinase n=1 Tax=Anopheles coluzzii TaxID=1518534 RepID=A0A8W7Q420_ANOCL